MCVFLKKNKELYNHFGKAYLIILVFIIIIFVSTAIYLKISESRDAVASEPQVIKATLKNGEILDKEITLTNFEDKKTKLNSRLTGISGILPNEIELGPKESKKIKLDVYAPEGKYGTFFGEAQFYNDNAKTGTHILIDSESERAQFDATIEQAVALQEVKTGGTASFTITIYNMDGKNPESLYVEYSLINSKGIMVFSETERASVSTGSWLKIALSKSIEIPDNLEPGKYAFAVKLTNNEFSSSASTLVDVQGSKNSILPGCDDNSCSGYTFIIVLIELIIGGFAYYYLTKALKNKERGLNLWILLMLVILISGTIYVTLSNTTTIIQQIKKSSGLIGTIFILLVIIGLLELIWRSKKMPEKIKRAYATKKNTPNKRFKISRLFRIFRKTQPKEKLKENPQESNDLKTRKLEHKLMLEKQAKMQKEKELLQLKIESERKLNKNKQSIAARIRNSLNSTWNSKIMELYKNEKELQEKNLELQKLAKQENLKAKKLEQKLWREKQAEIQKEKELLQSKIESERKLNRSKQSIATRISSSLNMKLRNLSRKEMQLEKENVKLRNKILSGNNRKTEQKPTEEEIEARQMQLRKKELFREAIKKYKIFKQLRKKK